ncbi:MAG: arginine--tRNA ligase [Candidatus Marinimicrobia bacterium]|nr:arginine--tRNA ligase [Candidatus Neomarinimicrobiota bacterium]
MKKIVIHNVVAALSKLEYPQDKLIIQKTKSLIHGDYSTNIAMVLTNDLKEAPDKIAKRIITKIHELFPENYTSIDIAGPGFINFKLKRKLLFNELKNILKKNESFGKTTLGEGKKALVEFVSANPTGPLTIGHGRGAILGDTISNILEWNGYIVEREYYFNNAGKQMDRLALSVYLRYCELLNKKVDFPDECYQGKYIYNIAEILIDKYKDELIEDEQNVLFKESAEEHIFKDIKNTLNDLGIKFDNFFNEDSLYNNKAIFKIIDSLKNKSLIYEKDGATWFKATSVGRNDDRVLIKSTGEPTYRLPDIAYHKDKLDRNFDLIIDVFGADHMDAYPDVLAALKCLDYDVDKIKVLIHQFATITENGQSVKMSTRKANFITLDELLSEVGPDVLRYFFLMRGMNTHLNFDINIAKTESDENPVFYLQYAYARISNIINRSVQLKYIDNDQPNLSLLCTDIEIELINMLIAFPDYVEDTLNKLEPQIIVNYLQALAMLFHRFYSKNKVLTEDEELSYARLMLIKAIKIVFKNGLTILGISHPEKM